MKNFIIKKFNGKSKLYVYCFMICFITIGAIQGMYGQAIPLETSILANFGMDADVHSGLLSFDSNGLNADGTDDWLKGPTGLGVIDEGLPANPSNPDYSAIRASLAAGDNIQAEFRMSVDPFTVVGSNKWLDGVYLRDQRTNGNNTDMNVFGATQDKNYNDPTTWNVKDGSVPQKNDITDIYAHVRRQEAPPPFNELWLFVGASTRSPNGNNYLDFEFFREEVTYDPVGEALLTAGAECGHTAYDFNTTIAPIDGDTNIPGDFIASANYTNGGAVADIRLFAWIEVANIAVLAGDPTSLDDEDFMAFNGLTERPFDFGDGAGNYAFHACDSGPEYGYARITPKDVDFGLVVFAQDNTSADVAAPSWGTIDPSAYSGVCRAALGSVIVKSRASTSFTAELKDLVGPFQLGDTPEYTVTISGDNITCTVECVELTATALPPGDYTYQWFKNGEIIEGESGSTIMVCEVGTYTVIATLPDGCDATSPPYEVEGEYDEIPPEITCPPTVNVQCAEDVPSPDISLVTATDNDGFDPVDPVITHVSDVSDGQSCPETITRTYKAVDACENESTCTQLIIINDTIAPVLDPAPGPASYQCAEDVPPAGMLGWTDNCDGSGEVQGSDSSDGQTCPETITRTWSYTDACDNTTTTSVRSSSGSCVISMCRRCTPSRNVRMDRQL
jgi:hypothetical protein